MSSFISLAEGFCNIQVLQHALQSFGLELVSYDSQDELAQQARTDPESVQAYICNIGEHWSTIRRFGRQYFDLNSLFSVPRLICAFELNLYLKFVQSQNYSMFLVVGNLPSCPADERLQQNPVDPMKYNDLAARLPMFCIDEKRVRLAKCSQEHGNLVLKVPQDLVEQYKKNPNDPEVLALIKTHIPAELRAKLEGAQFSIGLCPPAKFQSRKANDVPALSHDTGGKSLHPVKTETNQTRAEHVSPTHTRTVSFQNPIAQYRSDEPDRKLTASAALHEAEIQQLNDAWLERGMAESLASMNVPNEPVKETQQLIPVTTTSASASIILARPTVKEVPKVPSPCTTSNPSPMAPSPFWPSFDGKVEHQSAKGNFPSLETRQRRLVTFGNKDVSIIKRSCSSPTDWTNERKLLFFNSLMNAHNDTRLWYI